MKILKAGNTHEMSLLKDMICFLGGKDKDESMKNVLLKNNIVNILLIK